MNEQDVHNLLMAVVQGACEGLIVMVAMYYGGKALIELYFEKRRELYEDLEERISMEENYHG